MTKINCFIYKIRETLLTIHKQELAYNLRAQIRPRNEVPILVMAPSTQMHFNMVFIKTTIFAFSPYMKLIKNDDPFTENDD